MHVGFIECLLNPQVGCAWHMSDILEQLARPCAVAFKVVPDYLNVNGSRKTKVQNLRNYVGRQKREGHSGKIMRKA
jgi:hypothetical protein